MVAWQCRYVDEGVATFQAPAGFLGLDCLVGELVIGLLTNLN